MFINIFFTHFLILFRITNSMLPRDVFKAVNKSSCALSILNDEERFDACISAPAGKSVGFFFS